VFDLRETKRLAKAVLRCAQRECAADQKKKADSESSERERVAVADIEKICSMLQIPLDSLTDKQQCNPIHLCVMTDTKDKERQWRVLELLCGLNPSWCQQVNASGFTPIGVAIKRKEDKIVDHILGLDIGVLCVVCCVLEILISGACVMLCVCACV